MNKLILTVLAVIVLLAGCKKDVLEQRIPMDQMAPGGIQVHLNPHGITPLAAAVNIQTVHPSSVRLTVLGNEPVPRRPKTWRSDTIA